MNDLSDKAKIVYASMDMLEAKGKDNKVITSVKDIKIKDKIDITLEKGIVNAEVLEIKEN